MWLDIGEEVERPSYSIYLYLLIGALAKLVSEMRYQGHDTPHTCEDLGRP